MARRDLSLADYAVVAGIDLNGLGVLRSLGGEGVPVVALDTNFDKPEAATRFGIKRRIRSLSGPDFIADLLALRREFATNPVLLLTQEASVVTVSAAREKLSGAYRFTMAPHALMEDLLDKLRFQTLAERQACPIPKARRLFDNVSLEGISGLKFPCVVKPMGKHAEYAKRFAKAYKVTAASEVARLWSAMRDVVNEVIVQEWIEGSDSDVYFCLQYRPPDGPKSVSFVGRKICQWPVQVGGTASCMPAPEAAAELSALTDGFFSAVGFVGVGSMEYKRDSRDGKFYMVEPTVGRTDYQEEVAVLNGVNIPLSIYRRELGLPMLPSIVPRVPCAWRDPFGYAKARRAGAPDPMLQIMPGIQICDAYRRLTDPMPYVAIYLGAARNRYAKMFRPASETVS
jgi:D-aspartate ligase